MNSKTNMTSEPYRSLLKETLRKVMNILHFQISLSTIHRKMKKKSYKSRNLENQFQHGMIDLIDYNLYQIFKIILNIFKKKHETFADNFTSEVYRNKIEKRFAYKIKN